MTPLVRLLPYVDPLAACAAFGSSRSGGTLLLDSASTDHPLGRYSFLFADPFARLEAKDGRVVLDGHAVHGDPFGLLDDLLARWQVPVHPDVPAPPGAAAGCFSYELGRALERLPAPALDSGFSDLLLGFYDVVVCWDHAAGRTWVLSTGLPEEDPDRRARRASARLEACVRRLRQVRALPALPPAPEAPLYADVGRLEYEAGVARVIEHILAGDIYQANLSQRFSVPRLEAPFDIYRRLHRDNPAPFAAWLDFGEHVVASASPERFLRLDDGLVETRPIKGTRPRGSTPADDLVRARELEASAKDHAENVMIVDLLRNDLSRVCRPHTVRVPSICALESFATVHHLVSTVVGELREGAGPADLLRATFPGGSITGAPKIRAMEILADLEPIRRGPYCGSLGYIGFDGRMDVNIAIRTMSIGADSVTFHAGGGVTADSDPAAEYQETLDKARALMAAVGTAPDRLEVRPPAARSPA